MIGLSKLVEQVIGADVAKHCQIIIGHMNGRTRLQMMHDAQTHSLPASEEGFARLACLTDKDEADLKKEIRSWLEAVHALTEGFLHLRLMRKTGPENETGMRA